MKEHPRLLKHGAHLGDKATLAVIKNVTCTPGANRDTSAALLLLQLPAPEGGSAGAGGNRFAPGRRWAGAASPRLASPAPQPGGGWLPEHPPGLQNHHVGSGELSAAGRRPPARQGW